MHRTALLLAACVVATTLGAQTTPKEPPANGRNPVVSPDGKRIHYASDNPAAPGAYVINADGTNAVRLGAGSPMGRAVWSVDGKRLLFARVVKDTVRVVATAPDGTSPTELGFVTFREVKGAAVSADGSQVVFGAGSWTTTQLFAAALKGGAPPASITTPVGDAWWCQVISRDGKRIAVGRMDATRQMQVWVMDMNGRDARPVTRFTKDQGSPQCPAWSSDGKQLAVQSSVPFAADTAKHVGNIWVIDLASGRATRLGEHNATPYLDELPSWFPDGKRVAFQSNRTGRWELWAINVDGTGARQITR